MTHTPADADLWRAQLADMPWEAIVAFVEARGYVLRPGAALTAETIRERAARFAQLVNRDRLPYNYPPLADEDVPFDAERDGR